MDCRFGRMVTAPSAISSWFSIGVILEPQLSEPTQMKWPVWLAFLAAWRSRLWGKKKEGEQAIIVPYDVELSVFLLISCAYSDVLPKKIGFLFKCTLKTVKLPYSWCHDKNILFWVWTKWHWGALVELNSHHRHTIHSQYCGVLLGGGRMTPLPHLSRLVASGSKFGEL